MELSKVVSWAKRAVSQALDLVYPPECYQCDVALSGSKYVCESCFENFVRLEPPFCQMCGESYDGVISDEFTCPNCSGMEFDFEFAMAALKNSELGRDLVYRLKYGRQVHLSRAIGELMAQAFCKEDRFAEILGDSFIIVPVPLHWRRQLKRGFNQSEEIAEMLSRLLGQDWRRALTRKRNTESQTKLGRNSRLSNLKGCFKRKRNVWGAKTMNVLLVDDVLTTGSTAHECAKVLREMPEVGKVAVLTLMRG